MTHSAYRYLDAARRSLTPHMFTTMLKLLVRNGPVNIPATHGEFLLLSNNNIKIPTKTVDLYIFIMRMIAISGLYSSVPRYPGPYVI